MSNSGIATAPQVDLPSSTSSLPPLVNRGWTVTFAGTGINLALGILYTWSVISAGVPKEWGWTETQKTWPYSIACLIFCLAMIPAGRMQDRIGPRVVATIGGLLVGAGMILASFMGSSAIGYMLGFGVLAAIGIGFGYAAATPPAVKWFPAKRTGLIAGLVVSGFGLASVYAAPLASYLIKAYGLSQTMLFLGIGFLVVVMLLAQLLAPPPKGYVPAGTPAAKPGVSATKRDVAPLEVLKTWQFYVLWFMYACGAGAGLMIISKMKMLASTQAGLSLQSATLLVSVLAVGNGAGRIVAGMLSDRIGRNATLFLCYVVQAVTILLLSRAQPDTALASFGVMAVLAALVGANYGANLSLFPSITKDFYGLKNFGVNYGLVFTAWGLGGFVLSLLAGMVYDRTHSLSFAYYCSAGLLVAAALVTFVVQPPKQKSAAA